MDVRPTASGLLVWLDILTPKEVHYFARLRSELLSNGHSVLITSRKYDVVSDLLRQKGMPHTSVGSHGGKSLDSKLEHSLQRQLSLWDFLKERGEQPDALCSISSPEACRIAYGLGLDNVVLNDAPHAEAVSRLTVPLATTLVTPSCISPSLFLSYGAKRGSIVQFEGVDEVAWIREYDFDEGVREDVGVGDVRYVVFRPPEMQASYLRETSETSLRGVVKSLAKRISRVDDETEIVVLPRYGEDRRLLEDEFGDRVKVTPRGIDAPSLSYFSELLITGGGTMCREAALMGVPSISFFPLGLLSIEEFLMDRGFPLWHYESMDQVIEKTVEILRTGGGRSDVRGLLQDLEDPIDTLMEIFERSATRDA